MIKQDKVRTRDPTLAPVTMLVTEIRTLEENFTALPL